MGRRLPKKSLDIKGSNSDLISLASFAKNLIHEEEESGSLSPLPRKKHSLNPYSELEPVVASLQQSQNGWPPTISSHRSMKELDGLNESKESFL
jgi:hypothetical protein